MAGSGGSGGSGGMAGSGGSGGMAGSGGSGGSGGMAGSGGSGGSPADAALPDAAPDARVQCTSNAECDDGNPCTADTCSPAAGMCMHMAVANGTTCATDRCLSGQSCLNGICQGGTAISCDDQNVCTADSCDAMLGCQHVPQDRIACGTLPHMFCCSGQCQTATVCTGSNCGPHAFCGGNVQCTCDDPTLVCRTGGVCACPTTPCM